jgi:putative transcriptional regulator
MKKAKLNVLAIREKTGLSQPEFARLFKFSVRTLQSWEQEVRSPSGPSRTLLLLIDSFPVDMQRMARLISSK